MRQVSRYARIVGHTRYDVAAGLAEALTPVQTNHYVTISDPAEIGHLLRAIDAYTGEPSICFALKILPFVFVRSIGLRGAEWGEFDFDAATWIIPAERMKMKRPHTVPLARQVIALLHTPHLDRKRTFPLSKPRQCQPPHFRHGATERTTPHGLMPRRYDNSRIQKHGLYPAQ